MTSVAPLLQVERLRQRLAAAYFIANRLQQERARHGHERRGLRLHHGRDQVVDQPVMVSPGADAVQPGFKHGEVFVFDTRTLQTIERRLASLS